MSQTFADRSECLIVRALSYLTVCLAPRNLGHPSGYTRTGRTISVRRMRANYVDRIGHPGADAPEYDVRWQIHPLCTPFGPANRRATGENLE